MNVKAIPMSDLLNKCDDIYKNVMIVAQRSKQIIDERVVPIDENDDVEDSIEFELPIVTTHMEKPESVALEEFIDGELKWRVPSEDDQPVDES